VVSGPFAEHAAEVSSVAFLPDGKYIISGLQDTTIWIWDLETGEVVSWLFEGHTSLVNLVSFSPDSKCIVSGSSDHMICVLDNTVGTAFVVPRPYEGHTPWSAQLGSHLMASASSLAPVMVQSMFGM
jgi:WD40 repeat protein